MCYRNNTMPQSPHSTLSRRERLIMDILYRLGRATANEVMSELPGEPNYSTVRTQLRVLETKGHVRHEEQGLRFVYLPTAPRYAVRQSALRHLLETFFEGSAEKMLSTLLGSEGAKLSDEELDRLAQLIEKTKKGSRR
jgi:BlaI family transcriptional regulator, penicillinase repressor